MGSYLLKAQLQMQSAFLYVFNQLIRLFRSKENFKEKVDSDSNLKAAWPRITLKRLRLS